MELNEYLSGNMDTKIREYTVPYGGVFVHNVLDTSKEPKPAGYTTFLDYWEDKAKTKIKKCVAKGDHRCEDGSSADVKDLDGAHVRVDDEDCPSDEAWIVPLCSKCNNANNTTPILIPAGTKLIPIKMSAPHDTASDPQDVMIKNCWKFGS